MTTLVRADISLDEIRKKESEEKRKIVADRIRAVRLAKEANYHYKDIPKLLGKEDPAFVRLWVTRFNEGGFEALETREGRGRKPIIDDEEIKILEQWLKEPEEHGYNVWTASRLREKIKQEWCKEPSEQCVYDTLKRLGFKHRKARPTPSKADKQELENFKKSA